MNRRPRPITVGDIRNAIRNLPNTAFVLFADPAFSNDRQITGVGPISVHDGRYGPTLKFKSGSYWFGGDEVFILQIGGMAVEWGNQSYQEFEHDTSPGIEPDPDPINIEDSFDPELDRIFDEILERERR